LIAVSFRNDLVMSAAIKSLLLDLDGTLIDSRPGIMESYRFAAETVLPGQAYDAAGVLIGPPLPQMFQTSFPKASAAQIESLIKIFREHYSREGLFKTVLFDSVTDLLALCHQRGIDLYIATNKPLRLSTSILDHLKIARFFRSVLAVDSIQPPFAGKAAMIRHLAEIHHISADKAIYVGDTGEDAAAAAACGLRFVWAAYGYGKLSADQLKSAFRTIHRFGELRDALE
jgi:phosphoglycolate phosphatase